MLDSVINQGDRTMKAYWWKGPCIFLLVVAWTAAVGVQAQEGYRVPAPALVALVDAPSTPGVTLSPDKKWLLLSERPSLPSIEELSQPELRIAGMRINPRTNGRSRRRYSTGLQLKRVRGDDGPAAISGLPRNARIGNVSFSPDSRTIAFTVTTGESIELWVAVVASRRARRLFDARLNAVFGSPCSWLSDSHSLVCRVIPTGRGAAPEHSRVPKGPVLQESTGRRAPVRTYQDLLKSPDDEKLFEHYATSEVVRVSVNGSSEKLKQSGMIRRVSPSPDGKMLLVETVHRPFSYLVPASRFPYKVEVWDTDGRVVKEITDRPLADDVPIPFGSVPTGPRSFGWRADVPAALYWTEAQDGGNAGRKADIRDKVFTLAAPFTGKPRPLITLTLRYAGIQWASDELALVNSFWWQTRTRRVWRIRPGNPGTKPEKIFDYSTEDRYNNPGIPLMTRNASSHFVLLTGGDDLFLRGQGASPQGNRPFLDRFNLSSNQTNRLFHSEAPYYEYPIDFVDIGANTLLTRRESVDEPANYFLRNLDSGSLQKLTEIPHPTPQLKGVYKELIKYKRADGVDLSGTLYLPPGKNPGDGPFPVLMWAYPREYKDARFAGQVRRSPYRFTRISPTSSLIYLAAGYAIFDDPIMPIIGEGDKEPNDTYIEQLVSSAKAAVDVLVERGIADRNRIAIAGHSYGAFMVANLLAHSDLFAAGVARSGAYNRTLTPFGFQAEERTFWQAPEIYFRMSPFMHADKVNEPILLIHGEADNNSGTFPIQSRRYYHALKGHGARVRLVMLPHESHGYRARESVLHMLWETVEWLDKYVAKDQRASSDE